MRSEKKKKVSQILQEMEKSFTKNLDKFSIKNQNSYFFRLFSKHVISPYIFLDHLE